MQLVYDISRYMRHTRTQGLKDEMKIVICTVHNLTTAAALGAVGAGAYDAHLRVR